MIIWDKVNNSIVPTSVLFFDSKREFQNYIEKSINELKTAVGLHMRQIDEVRRRHNNPMDIRSDVVTEGERGPRKFFLRMGKKDGKTGDSFPGKTKQLEVSGFKVLLDPTPEYELRILDDAITSLHDKIETFEKCKELFAYITDERTRITAVLDDGNPTAFVLRLPQ